MRTQKIFLTMVGTLYLGLALWCSVDPVVTSAKVGLERIGGSGGSEFLTVYGGLEFAMATLFLLPWKSSQFLRSSLLACLLIHASLVVFRSIGFAIYSDISGMTYRLAIGEWVIFLTSLVLFLIPNSNSEGQDHLTGCT